jgi:hypothetical protein
MLVGQRFGLKWLAAPVATFVALYPQAECDLYPGDLSINALIVWREIFEHAPDEARSMLSADFSWIDDNIAADPKIAFQRRQRRDCWKAGCTPCSEPPESREV